MFGAVALLESLCTAFTPSSIRELDQVHPGLELPFLLHVLFFEELCQFLLHIVQSLEQCVYIRPVIFFMACQSDILSINCFVEHLPRRRIVLISLCVVVAA